MKKVLMLASVASMIDKFNMDNIKILEELGYSVDIAANFDFGSITSDERVCEFKQELAERGNKVFNIPIPRKISDIKNIIKSYKMIKGLCSTNKYEAIHCHSPIGGALGRIAARKTRKKNGTKVIYTAHGFHFFKGAPLLNWLIYFPLEWVCSFFTDVLITINKEDYNFAKKHMKAKRVEYVPGVGIDINKFQSVDVDKAEKRRELGICNDKPILLSVGELNKNKNHETVIRAIADLDVFYVIAGEGVLKEHLQSVITELGLNERVKLLGYCKDIAKLNKTADIYVLPSVREGLNVSLMEAMASGLPVACSKIRGNVDLIDKQGGVFFEPESVSGCESAIKKILNMDLLSTGNYNAFKIKNFSKEVVHRHMERIYNDNICESADAGRGEK